MTITNKAKCAVRAMMYLALNQGTTLTIQDIYEKEQVSKRYLEQVFSDLKRYGLVSSIKGKNGGYYLAHQIQDITAKDIVLAVEGHTLLGESIENHRKTEVELILDTVLWEKLNYSVLNVLGGITLHELIGKYNDTYSQMFYI